MGTMVSLTSVQPLDRATQDTVISAFVDLEERFSLYRDDTEAPGSRELNLHTVSDALICLRHPVAHRHHEVIN